ncbi:uncharacterized protein LOC109122555 [Vitis vinifera]|uniref:uncharacterized protein LOC109122555 n=1 Tax=Vitis vinifera TaxID=29760 RepID=UPI002883357B|nr:uncharacterized protein LOC109122555 [Vitis vinifera]
MLLSEEFKSATDLTTSSYVYEKAKFTMAYWLERLASGPSPKANLQPNFRPIGLTETSGSLRSWDTASLHLCLLSPATLPIQKIILSVIRNGSKWSCSPKRSAAAAASLRRRRTTSVGAAGGASGNMLQFYTDDVPGLKISPNVVLVMSIGFIAFVATLHVMGKLYFVRREA